MNSEDKKNTLREEIDKRVKYHYRWNPRLLFGILLGIVILNIVPDRIMNNIPISAAIILASYLVVDFTMTWYGKRSR